MKFFPLLVLTAALAFAQASGPIVTVPGTPASPAITTGAVASGEIWGGGAFRWDQANPVGQDFEPSILFSSDGSTAYKWSLNGFSYATDESSRQWTLPDPAKMPGGMVRPGGAWHFPFVNQDPATGRYYCAMNTEEDGTGAIYLWSAQFAPGPWTAENVVSGTQQPIVTRNTSAGTNWNYKIFNCGFTFVGPTIHLVCEGLANTGPMSTYFSVGYSYSTLAAGPQFDAHMTSAPIASKTNSPALFYVPERNALVMPCGDDSNPDGIITIRARSALLSSDLTLPASWPVGKGFGITTPGIHSADPTIAFTSDPTKTFGAIVAWNYNQTGSSFQAYANLTAPQFYDMLTSPEAFASGQASFASTVQGYQIVLGAQGNTIMSDTVFLARNLPYTFFSRDRQVMQLNFDGVKFGGTPGVTDMLSQLPQNAGSGVIQTVTDATFTSYRPITYDASTFLWRSGGSSVNRLAYNGSTFDVGGMVAPSKTVKIGYAGTVTLASGAATVTETRTTANSSIVFSLAAGGVSGTITQQPFLTGLTVGGSFTVQAGAADNSTYNYSIVEK